MNVNSILILSIVAGIVAVFTSMKKAGGSAEPAAPPAAAGNLDDLIKEKAFEHNIPFAVLKALVRQESNFDPNARNDERLKGNPSDDALGLMQIRQGAVTDYNRAAGTAFTMEDLFDSETNLEIGSWYLGGLIERNGLQPGVMMYNVGETGYKRGVRNATYLSSIINHSQDYA